MDSQVNSHFTCGICFDTFTHPYTIVDCLHKFDKECIIQAWKTTPKCPMCKKPSTKALYDFSLNSLIESLVPGAKDRLAGSQQAVGHEDIFPPGMSGRGYNPYIGISAEIDEDEGDEDEDDDGGMDVDFDERPGGTLAWPCPACDPANQQQTGRYVCPHPIPLPTAEEIQHESETNNLMGPPRAPLPHEPRVYLAHVDHPSAAHHIQCNSCQTYVPSGHPNLQQLRCTNCSTVTCGNFAPPLTGGNCVVFRPRNDLLSSLAPASISRQCWPQKIRMNAIEIARFEAYLIAKRWTLPELLEQIATWKNAEFRKALVATSSDDEGEGEMDTGVSNADDGDQVVNNNDTNGTDSDDAPEAPSTQAPRFPRYGEWPSDGYFCTACANALLYGDAYKWWEAERARAKRSLELTHDEQRLSDCWHGYECWTQTHPRGPDGRPSHAERFNHVCQKVQR